MLIENVKTAELRLGSAICARSGLRPRSIHASSCLRHRGQAAFTLVEILVASVLSVIIIGTLLAALNTVTNSYNLGSSRIETSSEARSAIDILRRDLAATYSGRVNDPGIAAIGQLTYPRNPTTSSANTSQLDFLPPLTARLTRRILLPFEVNRIEGAIFDPDTDNPTTATKSVANALGSANDPDSYHPNYDTIAFVTRAPLSRQSHTAIDRSILFQHQPLANDALLRSDGDACLAAYYVAYTKNAALPNAPASMKLFRHFRDSGSVRNTDSQGRRSQGRAYHVLGAALDRSLAPRRKGRLDNADLPMLLTPITHYDGRDTIHPWPRFAAGANGRLDYKSLLEPPPKHLWQGRKRSDPDSEADLHADEPIAYNVIRFKVVPMTWLTDSETGTRSLAETKEINTAFGLNRNAITEWPVAVTPKALRVTLTVIDDNTASLLQRRNDWEEWENRTDLRQLINQKAQEIETLIWIGIDEL